MNDYPLRLEVSPTYRSFLKAAAEAQDTTQSEIVAQAITQYAQARGVLLTR